MLQHQRRSAIALFVLCLSLASISLNAGGKGVLISGVTIAGSTLTIDGDNFTSKTSPVVRLQGADLVLESVTETRIVATMSVVPPAGTYLLTVTRGTRGKPADDDRDDQRQAAFNVAVGAVGPQGPQGPQGDPAPVAQLQAQFAAQMAALQAQLNAVMAQTTNVSAQLSNEINARTAGHNQQQNQLNVQQNQLASLDAQIDSVQAQGASTSGLLTSTRNELSSLTSRVAALEGANSNSTHGFTEFINTGWHTFTVPSGVTSILVELWGAGGGGGSAAAFYPGGGGGGGGYVRAALSVQPNSNYSIYVGAGGAGGTYSGVCGFGYSYSGDGGEHTGLDGYLWADGGGGGGYGSDGGGGSAGSGGGWTNYVPSGAPWVTGLLARWGGWGSWGTTLGARNSGVGGKAPSGVSLTYGAGGGDGGWQGACQSGAAGVQGVALISW